MKNLLAKFIIVLFIFSGLLKAQSNQTDYSKIKGNIERILSRWNSDEIPGFAIAVLKDNKVILNKGYGMADLEHNIPFTKNSVSLIGSITKQFTATALLLLEEQGKVSLDDPLKKYFPDFPAFGASITLYQLMHQTSGLSDFVNFAYLAGLDPYTVKIPVGKYLSWIYAQDKLMFEPGTKYQYSNTNYFLMALIIQKVTGMGLGEFAKKNIFKPLGMTHTTYYDDNQKIIPNRAMCYGTNEEGNFGNLFINEERIGPGGIFTTTGDLIKWVINFYNNKLGNNTQELINKLETKGKLNNGKEINYAGGLFITSYKGVKAITHTGLEGAYHAVLYVYPEQKAAVIGLFNSTIVNPDLTAIRDGLLFDKWSEDAMNPGSIKDEIANVNVQSWDNSQQDYTGIYKIGPASVIEVKRSENHLVIARPAGNEPLYNLGNGKYRGMYSNVGYIFQKNENTGKTELIQDFGIMKMPPSAKVVPENEMVNNFKELEGEYWCPTLKVTYYIKSGEDNNISVSLNKMATSKLYKNLGKDLTFSGDGVVIIFNRNNDKVEGFTLQNHRIADIEFKKISE